MTKSKYKKCIKTAIVNVRDVVPDETGVETLEGYKPCDPEKHFVMIGVKGEEYPIEKEIFYDTYEYFDDNNNHYSSQWMDDLLVDFNKSHYNYWVKQWVRGELLMIRAMYGAMEFDEDKMVSNFTVRDDIPIESDGLSGFGKRSLTMSFDVKMGFSPDVPPMSHPYDNEHRWGMMIGHRMFVRLGMLGWIPDLLYLDMSADVSGGNKKGQASLKFKKTINEAGLRHLFNIRDGSIVPKGTNRLDLADPDNWRPYVPPTPEELGER